MYGAINTTSKKIKNGSKVFVKRYQSTDDNYHPRIANAEQLKSTYKEPLTENQRGVFSIPANLGKKINNRRLMNMLESKHNQREQRVKMAARIHKVSVPINFSNNKRGYSKQFKEDVAAVDITKSMFDNHSKSIKKMVNNLSQMNSYLEEERKNMQSIQPATSTSKGMAMQQKRDQYNKSSAAMSADKDSERLMKLYSASNRLQG